MDMMERRMGRRGRNGGSMEQSSSERGDGDEMTLFRPFMSLQEQINRVFENFFEDMPMGSGMMSMGPMGRLGRMGRMGLFRQGGMGFEPRIDVNETANALEIVADVPGMSEKDIEITVTDEMMTISGERSYESEKEEKDSLHRERSYGYFMRRIPLPSHIERDKISAKFKDGVLKVQVPKNAEAKKQWRKIEVKRG